MALVTSDRREPAEKAVAGGSRKQSLFSFIQVLSLLALAAGCQQQVTTLSGWVSEGEQSSVLLLEEPEVELATAPVAGAMVTVHKRERGADRVVSDVRTDGTGHFTATILREPSQLASWQLTVEKIGYQTASTGWRRLPAKPTIYWQVGLAPSVSTQPQEPQEAGE